MTSMRQKYWAWRPFASNRNLIFSKCWRKVADNFMPAYGDSFSFMTYDGRNGDFDAFNGVFVSNEMTLAPLAGAADYSLVATPEMRI